MKMLLWRRVLAILLWVVYIVLVGAGGAWTFGIGLALYVAYLLFVVVVSNSVMSEIMDTLWD